MTKTDFTLTVLFQLSHGLVLVLEHIRPYFKYNGIKADWVRETKQAFMDIESHLRKACLIYETKLEKIRNNVFKNRDTGKFDPVKFDEANRDANELIRLNLLYMEKCYLNQNNVDAVFKFMRSLPGAGILTDEEIDAFRI